MKYGKFPAILCAMLALAGATSCSDPSFKVKGEISGLPSDDASRGAVVLEMADHAGYWVPVDSAELGKSGKFSISAPAPAAPQIYRLAYKDQYIYFPVDSTETVTVDASASVFATGFTLEGSDNAEAMEKLEKKIIAFTPHMGEADAVRDFKRSLYTEYLQNAKGSVVSYYVLTKTVGGKPLFGDTSDYPYFAAVATAFRQFRPGDPRTLLLENTARQLHSRRLEESGRQTVVQAAETGVIDISLTDRDGNPAPLSQNIGGGKKTLLMFTVLGAPDSPAVNATLRSHYNAGEFNIYQVGLDRSRLDWRNAAQNLPWTTVYGGAEKDAAYLGSIYNITEVPTYFIIDASGALTDRAQSLDDAIRLLR